MAIATLIAKYDAPIPSLAEELLTFLYCVLPDAQEEVDLPANMIAFGYGPGYKGMVCTVIFSKKELKLGIYKGTELPDPEHLLEGTGKVHKYVAIRTPADIRRPALAALLGEAVAACRKRLGYPSTGPGTSY